MSRAREEGLELSLDSFLNVMKIVIGVLILIVLVTVLGGGEMGVPSGAAALGAPKPTATRVIFECKDGKIYALDEEGIARRVEGTVRKELTGQLTPDAVSLFLFNRDVGDERHRVHVEMRPGGLAWAYVLRADAPGGESKEALGAPGSSFARALDRMGEDSFAYFVVHDDSFETFKAARALAVSKGIAVGWDPLEGDEPVRFSVGGSLGTRIH
ncbi:MAG: hypothetical protein JNL21_07590 [Myxococcales bacterium]|nr:hypothetical protein [Myxococcales bacterium]